MSHAARRPAIRVVLAALVVLGALSGSAVAATPSTGRAGLLGRRPAGFEPLLAQRGPVWPADAVPGSLLVTTAAPRAATRMAAASGGRVAGRVVSVRVRPGQEAAEARRLRSAPGVIAVEPDRLRPGLRAPNDQDFPRQWAHEIGRSTAAWDLTVGSAEVEVAVIDSGVDGTHTDLAANVVEQVRVSNGVARALGVGIDNDACGIGHGTFVAGVIGAAGDNTQDTAGVAWQVSIVDIAASDSVQCGLFADSDVLAALQYAIDRGVDVVNLSLGAPADTCPTAFQTAFDDARRAGVVVVAAAGNEQEQFPGVTSVPASCNGVISVGAVGDRGAPAPYSNANDWVDLVAPGGDMSDGGRGIVSTALGGGVTEHEGTSFAAPFVAGATALLRALDPSITAGQVEAVLEETAQRTSGRRSAERGWGIVDVGAATQLLQSAETLPTRRAEPLFPVGLVVRLSAQDASTDPVRQAVAVSKYVFRSHQQAAHVLLARSDDFADALSGSSLGYGVGPLLFAGLTGELPTDTRLELERVLAPGGIVYLLGGTAALPAAVADEVTSLGYTVQRLAGATREETAAEVARTLRTRLVELGGEAPSAALLVTAREWPDAITAGSLGAWFGVPILLTKPDSLSPATRVVLEQLRPQLLYVIGGTAAVSAEAAAVAGMASGAGEVVRLAGADRHLTAVAVAREFQELFRSLTGIDPLLAVGVNLRRADGFTHALSATSAIGARSGVFLPLDGERGETVPAAAAELACSLEVFQGLVVGESDVVQDETKQRLNALLEHTAC